MTKLSMRFDLRVPPFAKTSFANQHRAMLEMVSWADRVGVQPWPFQTDGDSGLVAARTARAQAGDREKPIWQWTRMWVVSPWSATASLAKSKT